MDKSPKNLDLEKKKNVSQSQMNQVLKMPEFNEPSLLPVPKATIKSLSKEVKTEKDYLYSENCKTRLNESISIDGSTEAEIKSILIAKVTEQINQTDLKNFIESDRQRKIQMSMGFKKQKVFKLKNNKQPELAIELFQEQEYLNKLLLKEKLVNFEMQVECKKICQLQNQVKKNEFDKGRLDYGMIDPQKMLLESIKEFESKDQFSLLNKRQSPEHVDP